ncbi:MAG: NAD(P)H-dependent oxidoreductase subunit E [Desulfobacteraceae bacterium 4572_19]|nr:MAG: NAD(P)H-dependent oxidoreductase subunit E [Desulfobacteraceae bacterium 4572_19]
MMFSNNPQHSDITDDMWHEINNIIDLNKDVPGALITVLRKCQDVVGYLPVILLDHIAYNMNLPVSDVFGVTTFYSLFSLVPKGRNSVKVCTGTACYVKGIKEVINRIENKYKIKEGETSEDRRFSLEGVRCLGACGLAPVMVVNQDIFGDVKAESVLSTLEDYK